VKERRRPNAVRPEVPPGAIVRTRGESHTPIPAWTPSDYWARRQQRRAWKQAEREGREVGDGDVEAG
jgi:hypothetical protein